MTVHSQLTWKLRRIPHLALPASLRLPRASDDAFAPLYAQVALTTLVSLAVAIGALMLITPPLAPAALSFTDYEAIFPGAPIQAVVDQGFTCNPGYNASRTEFCAHYPESGPFLHIGVWVADGVIRRVTFTFHEGEFRLGDIPWEWNRNKTVDTRLGNFRLSFAPDEPSLQAVARTEDAELNPFLPLQWVTVVKKP